MIALRTRTSFILASSTAAIALMAATPAWAQAAAESQNQEATAAETDAAGDIVVTGRFLDTGASSASKMDIRVLDTPFSVASYNNNFLKAIETTNVSDLYRYMTGIQRAGNTSYDITFRGFKTSGNDRNAIMTDGLPGQSVRFGSPPTVGVDHIELVKGATSVLYGQAQPGGFINIITKKPQARPSFEISLRGTMGIGEFDRAKGGLLSMDFTGPVTSDGSLLARVVAEGGYNEGFRKDSYEEPIYFAPSLAWKPDDRTTITLQGEYRYVKTHYDTYLVAPNRDTSLIAKIDTTYQEKDDYLIERGAVGNVYVASELTDNLKLNAGFRYVDHYDEQNNFDLQGFAAAPNNLTTVTRRARGQANIRTYAFGDVNLTWKGETFGIKHTLLVGGSGGKETASLNRTRFYNCAASTTPSQNCTVLNLNIYNPVLGAVGSPQNYPLDTNLTTLPNLTWRYTTQTSLGFYASDLIEFNDMFKVLLGVRYADERQTIEDLRKPAGITIKKDNKWLPSAGVLFQPMRNLSFYASYATSFVPTTAANQDVFGLNPFPPTEAEAYEGGVKAELFNRRLNITAAYFDITKKNTLNTFTCPANLAALQTYITTNGITVPANAPRDAGGNLIPASGTCSNVLGGERSRGFEIEFNGSPLPGWVITGGYAHTTARVTQSNIAPQNGARLTNSPDDAFNIWSRYDFQDGALKNLGVGVGVSYIGDRAGLLPTATTPVGAPGGGTLPLASYTTVDTGIYYKASDTIDLTFKVTNLLDERYIESSGFSGDIQLVPGTPRTLTVTIRSHF